MECFERSRDESVVFIFVVSLTRIIHPAFLNPTRKPGILLLLPRLRIGLRIIEPKVRCLVPNALYLFLKRQELIR